MRVHEGGAASGHQGIDVLVAEDNQVNQYLLSQVLEGLGCRFRIVSDGYAAVQAFADLRPKLVLMDTTLPALDGYEACVQIRSSLAGQAGGVRIVGLVPGAALLETGDWRDAGMDDCMAKPLNPLKLEAAVADWLGLSAQREVA